MIVLPFWGLDKHLTLQQNKRYDRLVDDDPIDDSYATDPILERDNSRDTKLLLSHISKQQGWRSKSNAHAISSVISVI